MSAALKAEGLSFVTNPNGDIPPLGRASLRCLVIENQCVVTITALGQDVSAADRATLQTYLRWLHLPWGIVFHFGREQTEVRVVNHPTLKEAITQIQGQPQIETDRESSLLPESVKKFKNHANHGTHWRDRLGQIDGVSCAR